MSIAAVKHQQTSMAEFVAKGKSALGPNIGMVNLATDAGTHAWKGHAILQYQLPVASRKLDPFSSRAFPREHHSIYKRYTSWITHLDQSSRHDSSCMHVRKAYVTAGFAYTLAGARACACVCVCVCVRVWGCVSCLFCSPFLSLSLSLSLVPRISSLVSRLSRPLSLSLSLSINMYVFGSLSRSLLSSCNCMRRRHKHRMGQLRHGCGRRR